MPLAFTQEDFLFIVKTLDFVIFELFLFFLRDSVNSTNWTIVTDRIRRTREGYIMTRVCLSVHNRGGGYPTWSGRMGYLSQVQLGVPDLAGGTPPGQVGGTQPGPAGGSTPARSSRGCTPPGQGVTPARSRWAVPPVQDNRCSTWYGAVGMPLA